MNRVRTAPRRRRFGAVIFGLALVTAVIAAMPAGARPTAGLANGKDLWKHVPGKPAATKNGHKAQVKAEKLRAYTLDRGGAAALLATAPAESPSTDGVVVSLPAPTGELQRFALEESPVLEPALAARHPEITTYAGKGLDDPTATIRADLTPLGFHASVRSAAGAWYIDPVYERDDSLYASYFARDLGETRTRASSSATTTTGASEAEDLAAARPGGPGSAAPHLPARAADRPVVQHLLRRAGERDGGQGDAVNRVTQIYEDETAIRLVLIADNDVLNLNTDARHDRRRTARAARPRASPPRRRPGARAARSGATGS